MTEIKSVVCPICGCLCDDIEVTVENNEIVKMKNGCSVCEAKMVHGYKSEERILKPANSRQKEVLILTAVET